MKKIQTLFLCIALCFLCLHSSAQNPNILLVIADDVGVDPVPNYLSTATKANMPNLGNLISEGVTFGNVWSNPVCAPTRATILTGKYGFRTNVLDATTNSQLSVDETSLHEYIDQSSNGTYNSTIIGKWHLNGAMNSDPTYPEMLGIQDFAGLLTGGVGNYYNWNLTMDGQTNNSTEYITTKLTDLAIDWIGDQEQPWFCWLAYNAPHTPFHLPPEYMHSQGNLPTDSASIADNPFPYYIAMLESVDYEMGRLLENLSPDELENTIVIFLGDNGTPGQVVQAPYVMNRAKGSLYQGGIHVPMVISGAGVERVGEREEALVSTADLFSTIVELTGGDLPQIHDSFSFADLLESEGDGSRPCMYSEVLSTGNSSGWAARDSIFKLIVLDNGQNRFYNLIDDPYEQVNLLNGGGGLDATEQTAFDNLLNYFTSSCSSSIVDAVDDLENLSVQIAIAPNPAQEEITIQWDNAKDQDFYIFDIIGNVKYIGKLSPGQNQLSVMNLTAGLYFLKTNESIVRFLVL